MNNRYFLYATLILFLLFNACKKSPKDSKQEAIELMTAQTMGIAYLEEFKLEEAETEFLKYIKLAPKDKLGYANLGLTYLRMGKYPEAEKQILKAIKIDKEDADTRLILATVYQMNSQPDKAISTLTEALEIAPSHIKTLYNLSEIYSTTNDSDSQAKRKTCLVQLVENVPANLVPQLSLIEMNIKDKQADKALERLEIIAKQFPEFPKEATGFYNNALDLLRKNDLENALIQFTIFHNYMKVTAPYQAGIMELKGPGGNLIGFPLIEYNKELIIQDVEEKSYLDVIKFNEVSESAGIKSFVSDNSGDKILSHVESADYDGDGDIDIYLASYNPATSTFKHSLYNNEMGRFTDVSSDVGIDQNGNEFSAEFADYDNDGFLDLYILKEDGDVFYRNAEKGVFKDITRKSDIDNKTAGHKSLSFDYDHDGDLDLFKIGENGSQMFRNNSDGTFKQIIEKTGIAADKSFNDVAIGDFDNDDDIDLIVTGESGTYFYSNQRQGFFKDITAHCGLDNTFAGSSVEAVDFNNDGFLDVFVTSVSAGEVKLFQQHENGTFSELENCAEMFSPLKNVVAYDAHFLDFDNDGYLDIIIAGQSTVDEERGVFLFHNDSPGVFKEVSHLLPENVKSARQISLFDYNDDGDVDILLAGTNGAVYLLRNDGGNINHYVNMKLVGLRTGSAKNNHFGIGAKVEVRSGDLYQTKVVTSPNIHFGLGHRKNADIIRITWTNGVPQNIFRPGVDQALIEAQTLKGCCPFLYAWNGSEYEFVTDITWRSALGMPLGIMGENTTYGFAAASDDYIKIPGEKLKAKDGKYSIQVTSELWETIYMDKIRLAVADHPESIDVFVPEQFTPPPFPGYEIYQVSNKITPVSAIDHDGNDVLSYIEKEDDVYLPGFNSDKYQGTTEMHSLILDPGEAAKSKNLQIFMKGWVFPTDASINFALSQGNSINVAWPVIQVINKKGEWETVLANFGFPMGKDKTVILDLSNIFITKDHRIRIATNMEIYWDYIFFSEGDSEAPVKTNFIQPEMADFHYRGFSRTYRKGGRYGPHWFDYSDVNTDAIWVDLVGNYTRYGDVLPLLGEADNQYVISNAGDEMTLEFDADSLPELPEGWTRDFFIHSIGWVKDGDLNTAFGNQVEPLPFHGMKTYPPSKEDVFPNTAEHQKYMKEYNTRVVTIENYRNFIKRSCYE